MDIVTAVLASFFIQLGSHFFPWADLLGMRKLPRLIAYTIGTLTIGAIYTLWLIADPTQAMLKFWAIVIASGAGVATGYGLDWVIAKRRQARELKQENNLLKEQRDEMGR